jgi:hypothetical protein
MPPVQVALAPAALDLALASHAKLFDLASEAG